MPCRRWNSNLAYQVRLAEDAGDGQGVVGGKLREDAFAMREQGARGCEKVQIRHRLAGEDRIVGKTLDLSELHLAIPIGALDEADGQTAVEPLGEVRDMVDQRQAALAIGLDRQAEPVPAGKAGIGEHGLDHLEREFKPLGLLGIDREEEIVGLGVAREIENHRNQLGKNTRALGRIVAWMQGRQLHRDPGPPARIRVAGLAADLRDRIGIGAPEGIGIGLRARSFAEHIEGIAVAPPSPRACALERAADLFRQNELAAHQPHRPMRCRAHGGAPEPPHHAGERRLRTVLPTDEARAEPERPGRGMGEPRLGADLVMGEIALAQLVGDQPVGGRRIRHPQQSLGEAHQSEPLAGGERIFAQQRLDCAVRGTRAHRLDQPAGHGIDGGLALGRQGRLA